jgi:hypothetical protein
MNNKLSFRKDEISDEEVRDFLSITSSSEEVDEEIDKNEMEEASEESEENQNSDFISEKINNSVNILTEFSKTHIFPEPNPNDETGILIYSFFYAIQYVIFCYKMENNMPSKINPLKDSPEEQCEKGYMANCLFYYNKFQTLIDAIGDAVYENILKKMQGRVRDQPHPFIYFIEQLPKYKEMHSRRIKSDPIAPRTKTTDIIKTYNAVTFEEFDPENRLHKTWHCLIINPLPSDFDEDELDGLEGGEENALIQEVSKINGERIIPEPFSIVVDSDWDKIVRTLHILLHFDEYMQTYVVSSISEKDFEHIKGIKKWEDVWMHLVGKDFVKLQIEKFSRTKKTIPEIVSRMAELRDILKESVNLVKIQ